MIHSPIMSYRQLSNFPLLIRNIVLLRLSGLFFHRFVRLRMDVAFKPRLLPMITAEALPRAAKSLLLTTQVAKFHCVLATAEEFLVLECSPLLAPMPVSTPTGRRPLILEARARASKCLLHSPAVPRCRHLLQPPVRMALSSLPHSFKDLARGPLLTLLRRMVVRRTGCKLIEISSILTICVYNATSAACAFTLFTYGISVETDFTRHGGNTATMMTLLILFSISFLFCVISSATRTRYSFKNGLLGI